MVSMLLLWKCMMGCFLLEGQWGRLVCSDLVRLLRISVQEQVLVLSMLMECFFSWLVWLMWVCRVWVELWLVLVVFCMVCRQVVKGRLWFSVRWKVLCVGIRLFIRVLLLILVLLMVCMVVMFLFSVFRNSWWFSVGWFFSIVFMVMKKLLQSGFMELLMFFIRVIESVLRVVVSEVLGFCLRCLLYRLKFLFMLMLWLLFLIVLLILFS